MLSGFACRSFFLALTYIYHLWAREGYDEIPSISNRMEGFLFFLHIIGEGEMGETSQSKLIEEHSLFSLFGRCGTKSHDFFFYI